MTGGPGHESVERAARRRQRGKAATGKKQGCGIFAVKRNTLIQTIGVNRSRIAGSRKRLGLTKAKPRDSKEEKPHAWQAVVAMGVKGGCVQEFGKA